MADVKLVLSWEEKPLLVSLRPRVQEGRGTMYPNREILAQDIHPQESQL